MTFPLPFHSSFLSFSFLNPFLSYITSSPLLVHFGHRLSLQDPCMDHCVCACVCMCVCAFMYVYVHICLCAHGYTLIGLCMPMHLYCVDVHGVFVCVCARVCVCVRMCVHAHVSVLHKYTYACMKIMYDVIDRSHALCTNSQLTLRLAHQLFHTFAYQHKTIILHKKLICRNC